METAFSFHGTIVSEAGLEPVARALEGCSWQVRLVKSGYDGTHYLREPLHSEFELNMQSGQSREFQFSGWMDGSQEFATESIQSFSSCLTKGEFVHRVELYTEDEQMIAYYHFGWPSNCPSPILL